MDNFIRGISSYVRMEAHVSFVVKYRHKVFDDAEFRGRCRQLLYQAAALHKIRINEMGFDSDHVHIILQLRCNQSLSWAAKCLKGFSGRKLLTEFPQVKRRLFWGSGLWSPAIFGDSLGREPEVLAAYVRNQGMNRAARKEKQLTNFFTKIPPVYSERTN
ncbi:MAG: IS200/IS605 family transposase [Candidatus Aenigmarchaeota archaeon]|nr:IS200/IS605 family transposase [Candidatus Aenigmarchaeota archaeon]